MANRYNITLSDRQIKITLKRGDEEVLLFKRAKTRKDEVSVRFGSILWEKLIFNPYKSFNQFIEDFKNRQKELAKRKNPARFQEV